MDKFKGPKIIKLSDMTFHHYFNPYGKIDPTNDFFISEFVHLRDRRDCFATEITTEKDNVIKWRVTVARTVYNNFVVYLTFLSVNDNPNCDKIKAKCDFYSFFGPGPHNIEQDTPNKVTTTNIYPKLKQVCIYTSNFTLNSLPDVRVAYQIRGTISEIQELHNFQIKIETVPTNVLKNFESFFIDQQFCDVTFQTSNTLLSAHKSILAAQSPVFKRMFSSDMKEKKHGIVINMGNVEGVVLKEMFRFMYGGRVENIEKMTDKLLILANKYEIEPLMTLCEKVLYDKLTISNAISMIKLADKHNAKNLRRLTEEFIIKNKTHLLDTAEFKSLTSTNPEIIIDIMKANLK